MRGLTAIVAACALLPGVVARNNHYERCTHKPCGTKLRRGPVEGRRGRRLVEGLAALETKTSPNREPDDSKLILFFHFHKAGGTSFCQLFKTAGLRQRMQLTKNVNCGCKFQKWVGTEENEARQGEDSLKNATHAFIEGPNRLIQPDGAGRLAGYMKRERADVCMLECGYDFPTPAELRDFAVAWRARGGKLAAVFREPWARFKSNYEREFGDLASSAFSEAAYNASLTATIGDYGAGDFRDTPMGQHAKTWGAINRPNYYVRLLNGLDLPHADAPSKREVANLT